MRAFQRKVSIFWGTTIVLSSLFLWLHFYQSTKVAFYFWTLSVTTFSIFFISIPVVAILEMFVSGRKADISFFRGFTIILVIFGGIGAFIVFYFAKNLISDIPYAITSNYSKIEGPCYEAQITGRNTFSFTVKNIKFSVGEGAKEFVVNGGTYEVLYLPNSKTVIEINPIKRPTRMR